MSACAVAALNLYPVKSCRGIALARAAIAIRGLVTATPSAAVGDREWMVVDPAGDFITQRAQPRLALVRTAIDDGALALSAPEQPPHRIPLAKARGATRQVSVWGAQVDAFDEGDEAAAWLTTHLGAAARLVRFDTSRERRCNPEYAGDSGAHTAFADGYPLLVIGEASLADLNSRLASAGVAALPMNRFRPNIVVAGLEAYDEDHLDTIEADGVVLKLVKPCTRCQVTTTDQETAVRGVEPLRTLAGYRHHARLGGVAFGMNAIVVAGAGRELAAGMAAQATFRF